MTLRVIAAPTSEPISLEDARNHLRLDVDNGSPPSHPDDALVLDKLGAAREWAEAFCARTFAEQTYELSLDSFPTTIVLSPPPLIAVLSVKYLDEDGTEQTLSPTLYSIDYYADPPTITCAVDQVWPTTYDVTNAVRVRYTAGYDDTASPLQNPLPKSVRAAILLVLGHLYANRENSTQSALNEIPLGAAALLLPYQLRNSFA